MPVTRPLVYTWCRCVERCDIMVSTSLLFQRFTVWMSAWLLGIKCAVHICHSLQEHAVMESYNIHDSVLSHLLPFSIMHFWKLCTLCSWRSCLNVFIINYLDQTYLKCQSAILILKFACFNNNCWIPSLVIDFLSW